MYAIIETGGKQYRVEPGDVLEVERLSVEAGGTVEFDSVLAVGDEGNISVGSPSVAGASVSAELVEHLRGKKVIAFKMKRRQGYKRRVGHRQELSRVRITDINGAAAE